MIARLFISPDQPTRIKVIEEELKLNNITKTHVDVLYYLENSKLGIAEARKIKEHFSLKPYSAKGRVVVLENADELTIDAQQALLKTIEELPQEAVLILGSSTDANLLPTILSRCQIIRIQNSKFRIQNYKEEIEKLLNSTLEERFYFIEKLKNKEEFLNDFVAYFRQMLYTSKQNLTKSQVTKFLQELLQAEKWAKQNVNIRAILEYLMLIIPSGKVKN